MNPTGLKQPCKQNMLNINKNQEAQHILVSRFQETLALGNRRGTTNP